MPVDPMTDLRRGWPVSFRFEDRRLLREHGRHVPDRRAERLHLVNKPRQLTAA
jgi:hypothetical protein